jgi:outer membrane protein insertion porin family
MIRTGTHIILATIFAALLFTSCSNTKKLPKGDSLYLGTSIDIKDKEAEKRERKVLQTDLASAVLPKPNKKVLGVRVKLTLYNLAGGDSAKKKGLRKLLLKAGEPPVLASQFNQEKNQKLLVNILENRGFFYPSVTGELKTNEKTRKAKSHFDVTTGPQYKIRVVNFVDDGTQVSKDVIAQQEKTILKPDAPYNLDLIKGERDRIDKQLKEIGYYYFVPDNIIVRVDTSVGDHKVDMYLAVKDDIPEEAGKVYFINKVFINPNYRLGMGRFGNRRIRTTDTVGRIARRRMNTNDTLFYERYFIVGNTKMYKPFIFTQAMQFYPGDPYNRTDQNISLNRLINMGTFKFVKNEFNPVEDNLLNVYYNLTPFPKKSLRAELGGYTKNDSRVGSQVSLSWRNRNTLRGAELLAIKGTAGFETQFGGGVRRPNTYQFGIEPSLTFPRFVIPFVDPKSSSLFVPRTTISAGYNVLLRQDLYLLHSFKASYGYQWKEDVRKEHQLFPINITYVKTDTINKDTVLPFNYSNLVFDGLIIGPTYQFTYNTRGAGTPNRNDFYFDGLIDLSGNILGLAQGSSLEATKEGKPKKIFGATYAQYLKLQTDFRYYKNYSFNPNSIWATRLLLGFGMPYGNSGTLPNIKQFNSGGNSSLRGFPSRLVGPGTFYQDPDDASIKSRYIETSGDIKLEFNTEVRAQLYQFVHGALFLDAGNIWTYRDYPSTDSAAFPGGAFTSKFLSQLAVNVGAGLRFDFKILVLRLDLGMPIRKPWLPVTANADGVVDHPSAWVFDQIDFGDSQWRKRNLVFNLGIGYPF